MPKPKPKPKPKPARPIDPVVVARERGQVLQEYAPLFPDIVHGHDHQPRGPPIIDAQWLVLNNVARYLGVSAMSIERYANDAHYAHLNFPKPSVVVDRSYWNRDDLDRWMRSRVGAVSTRKSKSRSAA